MPLEPHWIIWSSLELLLRAKNLKECLKFPFPPPSTWNSSLNAQRNLSQNLQHKFDNISNTPQDGDSDSTSPAKKWHHMQAEVNSDPDDQPSVEEVEADKVKWLGHRFVILYGPWLRQKKLIFEVELNEGYEEKKWFKDTNTMVQGQLCEIRGLLLE